MLAPIVGHRATTHMNESDAIAAFRRMGIVRPSRDLIDNWLRAAASAERAEAREGSLAQPKAPEPTVGGQQVRLAAPAAAPAPSAPACQPPTASPRPGKSLLEPLLHGEAMEQKPPSRRRPGRPRIVASWFPVVAKTMADGTTLRTALAINGLALSPNELRALYRNRTFQGFYQEARRRYLLENWGRKGPSLRAVLGRLV
jgi:hypothetical protein